MTAPAPDSVLQLLDYIRDTANARARQVAGWIDVYIHTHPPKQRKAELLTLMTIWTAHHEKWAARIDATTAHALEYQLSTFDWSETESALRTLLRDLEQTQ